MALIGILLLGAASTPVRADDGEGAGRGFLKIVEDVLPNIPMPDKFRSAGGEKVIGQIFSILLTEIKERQVRTEPEVRKAMVEEGRPVSDEPMVEIQAVHCTQAETTAGGNVTLVTRYIALGEKKLNPLKGRVDIRPEHGPDAVTAAWRGLVDNAIAPSVAIMASLASKPERTA